MITRFGHSRTGNRRPSDVRQTEVMASRRWRYLGCGALLVGAVACTSADTDSSVSSSWPSTTAPVSGGTDADGSVASDSTVDSAVSTTPSVAVTTSASAGDPSPNSSAGARQGEVIGVGSIGPQLASAQPWPIGTIYSDLEPQTLIIDFIPPNPDCIAARADASIGRGGAILVSVWVDAERTDEPCTASADSNQIRIALTEAIGDRRIYTSTVADTAGASERAELVADSIIGLRADDAIDMVRDEGFEIRDNTSVDAGDGGFNPNRINIWLVDGIVDFAAVY